MSEMSDCLRSSMSQFKDRESLRDFIMDLRFEAADLIDRRDAYIRALEANLADCFDVVSTTDVDQDGNNIERKVPKHHQLAADGARLEAQNKLLRDALEMISRVAGNLPDDILCSATGANDARYRGGLVCTARDIARAALEAQ